MLGCVDGPRFADRDIGAGWEMETEALFARPRTGEAGRKAEVGVRDGGGEDGWNRTVVKVMIGYQRTLRPAKLRKGKEADAYPSKQLGVSSTGGTRHGVVLVPLRTVLETGISSRK